MRVMAMPPCESWPRQLMGLTSSCVKERKAPEQQGHRDTPHTTLAHHCMTALRPVQVQFPVQVVSVAFCACLALLQLTAEWSPQACLLPSCAIAANMHVRLMTNFEDREGAGAPWETHAACSCQTQRRTSLLPHPCATLIADSCCHAVTLASHKSGSHLYPDR